MGGGKKGSCVSGREEGYYGQKWVSLGAEFCHRLYGWELEVRLIKTLD
jgi:hypothetical protein